jgi:hypothetical protein
MKKKNKNTFSWEGLGILLGILFLPLMIIGELLKTTGKSRKRGGVMCGWSGSKTR